MPEYLSPGVYVEEISTGPKPIEGVSTSVAGFLGPTERGPEDIEYVTSWIQYQKMYGGHLGTDATKGGSYMSYAVQGFFDNGGQRCFIGRVVQQNSIRATLSTNTGQLNWLAIGRGRAGNRIYVRIRRAGQAKGVAAGSPTANWVRVTLYYYPAQFFVDPPVNPDTATPGQNFQRPAVIEDFDNLSLDPNASNSIDSTINGGSNLVRLIYTGTAELTLTTETTVAPNTFTVHLDGGSDGSGGWDYTGDTNLIEPTNDPTGFYFGQGRAFAGMDITDEVSLLLAPDHVLDDNITQTLVQLSERSRYRFTVLSAGKDFKPTGRPPFDTSYGAIYYPWIKIYDTYSHGDIFVPPAGHVAGVIANTDIQEGVHKAPANYVLAGAKDLQKPVPKGDQDLLNPVGVNCMRDFRSAGRGLRVWGARTMSSDPEWKYINVRRLFIFIEKSIDEGTQWVVFESNDQTTWSRVVRAVTNFLTTLWRNGALFGANATEAFFVKCDRTTMTDDDIENGRLICYVGVAPVRPAEFVIFRIGQKTADAQS